MSLLVKHMLCPAYFEMGHARTVMYKVDHRGSHNASLKKQGLEKMTSSELAALIPVDEDFAHNERNWPIRHIELLERLEEKCYKRVLRADVKDPRDVSRPDEISSHRWREFWNQSTSKKLTTITL